LPEALGPFCKAHAWHGRHDARATRISRGAIAVALSRAGRSGREHLIHGSCFVVSRRRGPESSQQGQTLPDAERQGGNLHSGPGEEAQRDRAFGAADLLHSSGSYGTKPFHRILERPGAESSESAGPDAAGATWRALHGRGAPEIPVNGNDWPTERGSLRRSNAVDLHRKATERPETGADTSPRSRSSRNPQR